MKTRIVEWPGKSKAVVESFLKRPAFNAGAETVARGVLEEIAREGNKAVARYAAKFDGVDLKPARFRVTAAEIDAACLAVPARLRKAMRVAHGRVADFAKNGMRPDWQMPSPKGGTLGEQFTPLDRVGVYVPGGEAPLVSTAIMTATLAQVAGVPEIVACTPSDTTGAVNAALVYALKIAGVTEIYRVGGIQAIGMMAYGTRTVRKVQKIVGPGGTFVTAAKRQVYGHVALDLVAGPSEIAVLADDSASGACVAVDLLSQAEHGTGWEKALLVTPSMDLALAVQAELEKQAATLSRRKAVERVMKNGMLLVVVPSVEEGMALCNRFAPEHFEIMVKNARRWARKATHAGAVFIGPWTPESAGDFVAGPSHVLPTGGAAAMFSGLTVEDFRRRTSVIAFTKADLRETLPVIEAFGELEGLDAHARAGSIRFVER